MKSFPCIIISSIGKLRRVYREDIKVNGFYWRCKID